jgi:phage terminase Nu1 subunit (DNA packaging protein)
LFAVKSPPTKSQKKKQPKPGRRLMASMRWDLAKAAIEFGTDTRTLLKKLEQAHQVPDSKGKYSTRAILAACYDEQYRHRNELLKAQTDKLAIANEIRRGELVPVKEVKSFWQKAAVTLRPLILGMTAPDADKRAVFQAILELSEALAMREHAGTKRRTA